MLRFLKSHITGVASHLRKDIALCVLSAFLLVASFPRCNFEILAWIGFIPLFFALKHKTFWASFQLAYLTGIIFWLGVIYWLVHVTVAGTVLLILYLSLYFGLFGVYASFVLRPSSKYSVLTLPSSWVFLEFLRSHLLTGFPWALLGYSQFLSPTLIQVSDITGVWGVSFLVMMVNAVLYALMRERPVHSKKCVIFVFCILLAYGYGRFRINTFENQQYSRRYRVSLVQGNIPQELKWAPMARSYIINKYAALTKEAVKTQPDLIVWPEAALPVIVEEEPQYYARVSELAGDIRTPLLMGAVTRQEKSYYNSALLLSPQGRLVRSYNKLHLVPFGEYIPLKHIFPFLQSIVPIADVSPGREYTLFQISRLPLEEDGPASGVFDRNKPPITNQYGVLICFEDVFPELSSNFVKQGADFLINITNDGWYKQTSAPYQHLQASVFRAVENRVFLARAANTGISAFINPAGRVYSKVSDREGKDIFVDGFDTQKIGIEKRGLSFYTRFGDWMAVVCACLSAIGILSFLRKKS